MPAQRRHFQSLVRASWPTARASPSTSSRWGSTPGSGSAAFLEASPQVHVVSFDLAEQPHVTACAEFLRSRFPDRLHLVVGDSRETLPRYAAEAGARFDLLLIDAGHREEAFRADVANARALAAPGALVVVDDLMPHKGYGRGVSRGWEALLRERVLVRPEIWRASPGAGVAHEDVGEPPENAERRWGVARFGTG